MFKNFRNKVAVLALVAIGLVFGNAWSSQAEKTNGELIYEAIIKCELPDETSGMWEIAHEVAQEEKEQKEEQEQEYADSSTSNWTIRSNGTSPTETTLTAEIRSNIKTAIERLLKNDDVVKYITIHNIASGHMYEGASGFGEIAARGVSKIDNIQQSYINFLCKLKEQGATQNAVRLALPCAFDSNNIMNRTLFVGALRLASSNAGGYTALLNTECKLSPSAASLLIDVLFKDGGGEFNVPLYAVDNLKLNTSTQPYTVKMFLAAKLYMPSITEPLESTRTSIKDFLNNPLSVNTCDIGQLSLTYVNGKKTQKLILDIHRTKKCVYITHFGPAN